MADNKKETPEKEETKPAAELPKSKDDSAFKAQLEEKNRIAKALNPAR
jgi:hypothetical protein